jgi:hypothetical protein
MEFRSNFQTINFSMFQIINIKMVKTQSSQTEPKQRFPNNLFKKYKFRSERKMLINMCRKKLRIIEDPDLILCKSVLINNTLKFCQKALPKNSMEDAKVADLDALFGDSEEEPEKDHQQKEQKDKTLIGLSMPIIG